MRQTHMGWLSSAVLAMTWHIGWVGDAANSCEAVVVHGAGNDVARAAVAEVFMVRRITIRVGS